MKRKAEASTSSNNSNKSMSTTQQTGALFQNHFKKGFDLQNSSEKISDLREEINIKFATKDNTTRAYGDIDLFCHALEDIKAYMLFPATLRRSNVIIPKGSLLFFELTSMDGDIAQNKIDNKTKYTKVETKTKFYQTLFKNFPKKLENFLGVNVKKNTNFVFFVYNGADFCDVKFEITECKNVTTIPVHCPMQTCFDWVNDESLKLGLKLGREEERLKIVKELYGEGMLSQDVIIKKFNLTPSEIDSLKKT